jgi:hypothetical protein
MKATLFLLLAAMFLTNTVTAQDVIAGNPQNESLRRNSVYLEMLGNGAYYSFNYDRLFPLKKREVIYLRIGGSTASEKDSDDIHPGFIFEAGVLSGGIRHFFDVGLGYTQFAGFPDRLIALRAGYRFMGTKGFLVKAAPMYIYNTEKGDVFGNCFYFGLSLGYSF